MRALFSTLIAVTLSTTFVACGAGSDPSNDNEGDAGGAPVRPVDAAREDGGMGGTGGGGPRLDAATARDTRSDVPSVCTPGQATACECASTGKMTLAGTKICLESTGTYTQCGCAFEHPYPGPTCKDGQVKCRPTVNEETQYAARHCCTDAGACGLSNPDVTGGKCIASGTDPMGKATTACGETIIPFIQSGDCCRPDNKCGLWLQQGDNWDDLGCVERTGMATLLKNSGTLGFFLFLIGRGEALNEIKGKACNYAQP